jgi:hypothetical protein
LGMNIIIFITGLLPFIIGIVLLSPGAARGGTLWSPGITVGADGGSSGAVELGVKFRSDSNGYITGIRFYKHPLNTGTHTGNLWSANGTNLGRVVFSGETASGWQQADFITPIPITANTTYIASYHAPNSYFALSRSFFIESGVDNPPLHALKSGVDGPNGVFIYSAATDFPIYSYLDTNYWVDVVFQYSLCSSPLATGVAATPTLAWSDVSGADTYEVQVCTDNNCTNVVRTANALTSSQWMVSPALNPETQYFWRCRAANACNISPWSYIPCFITAPCLYTLSPTTAIVTASGGEYSAGVTAGTGCGWNAAGNDEWISIKTGTGGTGNGTVSYTVTANPGQAKRTGTITIAGQTLTVEQAGAPCSYSLDSAGRSLGALGGPGSVGVTAAGGCPWNAVSNAPWISITSEASGIGNGTVDYSVAANNGTTLRSGTLTIAGQTFTVEQAEGQQTCPGFPVRNANTGATYASLQESYDAALNGHTLQAQFTTLTGNLTLNRNIAVTLEGGYDCGFGYFSGINTILQGWIKTQPGGGTFTIKNFELE